MAIACVCGARCGESVNLICSRGPRRTAAVELIAYDSPTPGRRRPLQTRLVHWNTSRSLSFVQRGLLLLSLSLLLFTPISHPGGQRRAAKPRCWQNALLECDKEDERKSSEIVKDSSRILSLCCLPPPYIPRLRLLLHCETLSPWSNLYLVIIAHNAVSNNGHHVLHLSHIALQTLSLDGDGGGSLARSW